MAIKTKHEDIFLVSCSHGNYRILTMDDFVSKIFNDNKDYTRSDGIIYEGDWVDRKMTGKGVMIWPSGTKYEGEFFKNCRHALTKSYGDAYIRKFKNAFLHGNGKYTWSNGTIYKGNWVDGNMSGNDLSRFHREKPMRVNSLRIFVNWITGCLLLLASSGFWSCWMIMQVSISSSCPDHILSTCLFAKIQSAIFALLKEKNIQHGFYLLLYKFHAVHMQELKLLLASSFNRGAYQKEVPCIVQCSTL